MRILSQVMIMIAISTLLASQTDAYCAKCVKIEEERAKEQAAHPHPWRYYDDIADNSQTSSDEDFSQKETKQQNTTTSDKTSDAQVKEATSVNQVFAKNEIYSTIYTIVKTKNFLEALEGGFTLFIPTNAALMQLPQETLNKLARPEGEQKLTALVSNHIVSRKLLTKDFTSNNMEIKAISGRNLSLSSKNGKLYIGDAQILRTEPAGYEGTIYVIDKVLTTP